MKPPAPPAMGRRRALASFGAAAAAVAAPVALPGSAARLPAAPSHQSPRLRSHGTELTDHMRIYYERARY